ncbi:MAG: GspH/FimT family pseudopilin [Luteimonas sp.]
MGRDRSECSGFTLIELMVTIAVLAILLAVALPSFADFFDKYRLRGAVDDVVSVISNARAESVKADRDVNISFGGTAPQWCVGANAAVDPAGGVATPGAIACDCAVAAQCQVGGQRLAVDVGKHAGVTIGGTPAAFIFDSKLGLVTPLAPQSATFTSATGKYALRVNVNPLGQAVVCVPSGPAIAGVPTC